MNAVVVGCGWAGEIHAEVYHHHSATQLVAVCDPEIDKAKALSDRLGCQAYNSLEDLLQSVKFEIASLASSTDTHVRLGKLLLEENIPVLCEKPLSDDLRGARDLVESATSRNLPLGTNFNRRYASGYQLARERMSESGRVHFISSILAQNVPLAQSAQMRASLPVDFLVHNALAHQIDLARFLVGEPQLVEAFGSRDVPGQLWTDLQVGIYFANGALGSLICSLYGPEWGQLPIERTEIATMEKRIVVEDICARVEWFGYKDRDSHSWTPSIFEPVSYQESMKASISAWIEAVFFGNSIPITGEDGLRSVEICDQVSNQIRGHEEGHNIEPAT